MDSLDSKEFMEFKTQHNKQKAMNIKGAFSDFDRIFYQKDDINNQEILLLFSEKKQLFVNFNLENNQMSALNIKSENAYQQVEFYDNKLFCVNRELLTMDVFYASKKQQLFYKKTFCFANMNLRLKEDFCLIIWKHSEAGAQYRCLLGPIEDGRYMYFDLLERYFDFKSNIKQTIGRMIFIKLAVDLDKAPPCNIICAMDKVKKSIICFDEKEHNFFEYNDFCGLKSMQLQMHSIIDIAHKKLRKMYFYYPYDFFSTKVKNQLQAKAKNNGQRMDIEAFVRNSYKEILLCMEESPLLKIRLDDTVTPKDVNYVWRVSAVDLNKKYVPTDIAINEYTGEIYCLCKNEINIMENSNRQPEGLHQSQKPAISSFANLNFNS